MIIEIMLLVLLAFFASAVGTITSFGTSTIMVPVLALFYGFNPVLLFTGIVHAVGNFGKMYFFKSGINWRLIALFGIPGLILSYIGSRLVPDFSSDIVLRLLGAFILFYVIYILRNPEWKLPKNNKTAVLGGSLTGLSAAVFGVQGVIRATFLSAFDLKKEVFLFTAGAIGLIIDGGRLVGYLQSEIELTPTLLIAALISVPTVLFGSYIGKRVVDKIPQSKFRTVIAVALTIIALRYLIFA
ncbi:MAG: sulfite exporter TauE/SafE family protein [Candidatus Saccharibacteria bacterium]|nr:sulfite exporter TauE/SafE family protein [Candidatus Saccharibacteria bacterium]